MNLSTKRYPDLKEDSDADLLSFNNFLAYIGQYDDAKKYNQRVLNELASNHED